MIVRPHLKSAVQIAPRPLTSPKESATQTRVIFRPQRGGGNDLVGADSSVELCCCDSSRLRKPAIELQRARRRIDN
jgi:hypothetical protein